VIEIHSLLSCCDEEFGCGVGFEVGLEFGFDFGFDFVT